MYQLDNIINLQEITLEMQVEVKKFSARNPEKSEQAMKAQHRIDELNRIAETATGALLDHITFQSQITEMSFYMKEAIKATRK